METKKNPKRSDDYFPPFMVSGKCVCVCVVSNDYDPITPPLSKAQGTSKKEGRKVLRVRGQRELGKIVSSGLARPLHS